jgi:predicted RNA-binding protein with PIN domain
MIVWGAGAKRLSAQGLLEEVVQINREIKEYIESIK